MRRLAGVLSATLALACASSTAEDQDALTLDLVQAEIWIAEDPANPEPATVDRLPPADARWQAVTLPFRWLRGHEDAGLARAWIRLDFDAPQPLPSDPALYLSRLSVGGTFFVDGSRVAMIREADASTQVRWRRPHLIRIPPSTLHEGRNSILVRMVSRDATTVFPEVRFGSAEALRPAFDRRYLAEYSSAQFSAVAGAVVGAFMLGIWWFRRADLLYLLFGLTCLFWALRMQAYLTESVPAQWWWPWRALYYVWTGGFALSVAAFFLHYIGRLVQRWQLALVGYALIGPLLLLASAGALEGAVDRYWVAGLFVLETYVLWRFYRALRRQPSAEGLALGGGAVTTYVLGANDFAVRTGWMPFSNAYALHFGAPVVMLAMGGLLAARFVRALRQAELANVELTRKVDEKEHELHEQFERLRAAERREASSTERQRMMQDMHDGLGSQLLTSLAAVERGALDAKSMAQVLRDAIDDMRLAIDTLAPGREGLLEALGNLRYRLEPRFRAAGIELSFDYRDLPDRIDMTPDRALQVLRVLQESLTNALKHARATHVKVEVVMRRDPATFVLAVVDDGGGFDASHPDAGRGLSGMRRRAGHIDATLEVNSSSSGTRVTLACPLPGAS